MRSTVVQLALLGLAAVAPLATQNAQGAFVVTLGADTIVVEQYKRTGNTVILAVAWEKTRAFVSLSKK